jgi:hypothetical protein
MLSPLDWPSALATAAAEWTDRRLEGLGRVFLAGAVAVTCALGAWIVFSGVPTVRGVDLNVVLTLQKTLHGLPLYTDTAAPPFDIAQYSPLYYLLTLGVCAVLGVGGDDAAVVLMLGRVLSTLSTIVAIVMLVRFGRRSLDVPASLGLGAAGFAVVVTAPWLFLARPDAMALAMTLAALILMARSVQPGAGPALTVLTAIVAVAALFTKQSAIQIVPIVLVFYALLGRWSLAAVFAGAYAASAGAAWTLATWRWPVFAANVIGGVDNGISLFNAFDKTYAGFFPLHGALLAMLLIGLSRWVRRPMTWQAAFFLAALPGLLLVATATALKDGSASNYYNEFLFVGALAAAKLLHEARTEAAAAARPTALAPARVVAAFFICWLPFHVVMEVRSSWWRRITPGVSLVTPDYSLWSSDYDRLRRVVDDELPAGGRRWLLAFLLPANTAVPTRMLFPQKEIARALFERDVVDYSAFRSLAEGDGIGLILMPAGGPAPPAEFLGVTMPPVSPIAVVGPFRVYRAQPGGVAPRH